VVYSTKLNSALLAIAKFCVVGHSSQANSALWSIAYDQNSAL
jgi:hypothetical protein